MSAFSPAWLRMREEADARARDDALLAALRAAGPARRSRRIVDLGSGSGANVRYLAPRLGHRQQWLLAENDPGLIAQASPEMQAWAKARGHRVELIGNDEIHVSAPDFSASLCWQRIDLAAALDDLPLGDVELSTCSALLDLVSRDWISELVRRCRERGCAVLFALSYTGDISWRPELPTDEHVRTLLNRHQLGDKGFGPAAGPEAVGFAAQCLRENGFIVREARSDWRLSAADGELQATLAKGWVAAAGEMDESESSRLHVWLERRLSCISDGSSRLTVGHVDLLGIPPGHPPKLRGDVL